MGDNQRSSAGGGLGFAGALFIVFLVLKLTKVIDWSWWWITAPLWGGVILFLLIIGIVFAVVYWAYGRD